MSSLWKLNVVDIEVTLLHVCQMVILFLSLNWYSFNFSVPVGVCYSYNSWKVFFLHLYHLSCSWICCLKVLKENNVKREELKARAMALKYLGKIFQVPTCYSSLKTLVMFWLTYKYIREFFSCSRCNLYIDKHFLLWAGKARKKCRNIKEEECCWYRWWWWEHFW